MMSFISGSFLIISPSSKATHITSWIAKHVPSSIAVHDRTSSYCTLGLMGPKSREVLQSLTKTSLDNAHFPYSTGQVCMYVCVYVVNFWVYVYMCVCMYVYTRICCGMTIVVRLIVFLL